MSKNTFDTINGRPIFWTDKAGVIHRCEGADVHPGIRLIWTKCERDVPANRAFNPGDGDAVTCPECLAHVTEAMTAAGCVA